MAQDTFDMGSENHEAKNGLFGSHNPEGNLQEHQGDENDLIESRAVDIRDYLLHRMNEDETADFEAEMLQSPKLAQAVRVRALEISIAKKAWDAELEDLWKEDVPSGSIKPKPNRGLRKFIVVVLSVAASVFLFNVGINIFYYIYGKPPVKAPESAPLVKPEKVPQDSGTPSLPNDKTHKDTNRPVAKYNGQTQKKTQPVKAKDNTFANNITQRISLPSFGSAGADKSESEVNRIIDSIKFDFSIGEYSRALLWTELEAFPKDRYDMKIIKPVILLKMGQPEKVDEAIKIFLALKEDPNNTDNPHEANWFLLIAYYLKWPGEGKPFPEEQSFIKCYDYLKTKLKPASYDKSIEEIICKELKICPNR